MDNDKGQLFMERDEIRSLYRLTDEDVQKLHAVLLEMYKDVNTVCERNNIHIIAAGGTALGAIRHNGFIPWDDDMDVFMVRDEFERFKRIFDQELGFKYYLLAPGTEQGANAFLPRIMKKNTTLWGMIDETSPYPHGIYIDINIIEYAPENIIRFKWKAIGANIRRIVSYSVYWHQYKSKSFEKYMLTSSRAMNYRFRMIIGKICSFMSAESWFAVFDEFVQGDKSKIFTVPSGRGYYGGERLEYDSIYPLKKVSFESDYIYVVNRYDEYLRNLYGDYMKIPKDSDREHHLCLKLDFEREYYIL